jgi:hypothetical protein
VPFRITTVAPRRMRADRARAAVLIALGLVGTLPTFFQIFE